MALTKECAPYYLNEIVGNEDVVNSIQSMLSNVDTMPRTLLFTGERGCGKTTMANVLANELGIDKNGYNYLNSASYRRLADARELEQTVHLMPMSGGRQMFVLDESHSLNKDAQECLLTTLDNPPKRTWFVLCTTDPQQLKKTVKSRCTQFQMESLSAKQMVGYLTAINPDLSTKLANLIADKSEGIIRDALNMLEQVWYVEDAEQAENVIVSMDAEEHTIGQLCQAFLREKSWKEITAILDDLKDQNPEQIRHIVLNYMAKVLSNNESVNAYYTMEAFSEPVSEKGWPGIVYSAFTAYVYITK